ncbi:MAG: helix-turn-helix domain-containing protein [Phycisphaerales bacterium]
MPDNEPLGKLDFTAFIRKFRAQRLRTDAMLIGAGLEPYPSTPAPATPPRPPGKLLSLADASKEYGLSKKRIRHLVNTKQVRCVRHSNARNSHIYVVRASLEEWIDEQSR